MSFSRVSTLIKQSRDQIDIFFYKVREIVRLLVLRHTDFPILEVIYLKV